jgi:TetR/AcrR family transcriptional regulator
MARMRSGQRKQEILQTLAKMLESHHGARITTAALANNVGVSEAALYRHFPSKAKMLEALIEFIEESIFTRINRILDEEKATDKRLLLILNLLLGFAEKNPGISRLLQGDILVGEPPALRERMVQFYDRLETQLKQVLREGEAHGEFRQPVLETAGLLLAIVEGRIARFVRGDFQQPPTAGWEQLWTVLSTGVFSGTETV